MEINNLRAKLDTQNTIRSVLDSLIPKIQFLIFGYESKNFYNLTIEDINNKKQEYAEKTRSIDILIKILRQLTEYIQLFNSLLFNQDIMNSLLIKKDELIEAKNKYQLFIEHSDICQCPTCLGLGYILKDLNGTTDTEYSKK